MQTIARNNENAHQASEFDKPGLSNFEVSADQLSLKVKSLAGSSTIVACSHYLQTIMKVNLTTMPAVARLMMSV